ncbi:hypothetical protein [Streptomyces sp. NPDC051364]|uniref:hypothetical protein n=1 Tax=Streptomyces sp. NPDC051364 TaxID=3155799 RepID=UPI00344317F8
MDGHSSQASHGEVAGGEAQEYGERLAGLFGRTGARQNELAAFGSYHPSAVNRYFKGKRVAPKEFLLVFGRFMESRGVPLDAQEARELDALRQRAQSSSSGYRDQAAVSRERIEDLERMVVRLTEQVRLRQDQGALDDGLRQAAQAIAQEWAVVGPDAGRAGVVSQLAEEIRTLSAQVEELQRVRARDIGGGGAVDQATAFHVHHGMAMPRLPEPPFAARHPWVAAVGLVLGMVFFYAVGAAFGRAAFRFPQPWDFVVFILFLPSLALAVLAGFSLVGVVSRMVKKRLPVVRLVAQERPRFPRSKRAFLLFSVALGGYAVEPFTKSPAGLLVGMLLGVVSFTVVDVRERMREHRLRLSTGTSTSSGPDLDEDPQSADQ